MSELQHQALFLSCASTQRLTLLTSFSTLSACLSACLSAYPPLLRPVCASRSLSQGSANAAVLDVTQTGGHKKRVRRSSFLNAKKLYEDAQMARKVKQYLSHLSLESNEESLQTLSMQCEPSISTREWGRGARVGPAWARLENSSYFSLSVSSQTCAD